VNDDSFIRIGIFGRKIAGIIPQDAQPERAQ